MKFAVLNFILGQNVFQKIREDASPFFEEQLIIRRRRSNDYVAALLGLRPEIATQHGVHRIHCLRTAAKSQDCRIRLRCIISRRKNHLVMDSGTGDLLSLFEHFGSKGWGCKDY
jgi:hypothetical protein